MTYRVRFDDIDLVTDTSQILSDAADVGASKLDLQLTTAVGADYHVTAELNSKV